MKHISNTPCILALVVSLAACTTEFSSPGDALETGPDVPLDTAVEIIPDGMPDMLVDPGDVIYDTQPDGPPPFFASCAGLGEGFYVPFPDGAGLPWGCDTDQCDHLNLWLDFIEGRLVAIVAAENSYTTPVSRQVFAWIIDPGTSTVIHSGEILPEDPSISWNLDVSGGSLVAGALAASVIVPVRRWEGGTTPLEQNLRVISVWEQSGFLEYSQHDLLSNVMPSGEDGMLTHPRAIRIPGGDEYSVFVMMEEDGPIFMLNQLYGASFSAAEWANPMFHTSFALGFQELESTRLRTHLPFMPAHYQDRVVMPYMELDMDVDIGAYHSGIWAMPEIIDPGGPERAIEFPLSSSCSFDGMIGGATFPDRDTYGIAALCGESRFGMTGIDPPFTLNSAVVTGLEPGMDIEGTAIMDIESDAPFRDMEFVSLSSTKVMHDGNLGVYHYAVILYPPDEPAQFSIATFREDGTLANPDSYRFEFDSGSWVMPAADVALDPVLSIIYIANFVYPTGGYGWLDGFYINSVRCSRVDG